MISDVNLKEDDVTHYMLFVFLGGGYTNKKSECHWGGGLELLIYQLQLFLPLLPPFSGPPTPTESCIIFYKMETKRKWHKLYKTELKIIGKKFS